MLIHSYNGLLILHFPSLYYLAVKKFLDPGYSRLYVKVVNRNVNKQARHNKVFTFLNVDYIHTALKLFNVSMLKRYEPYIT